jgi:L-lactate dehydrogenase complex protein LldE
VTEVAPQLAVVQRSGRRDRERSLLPELPDAEQCCGFGGTFALKNPAVSSAMLADKITAVRRTGAEYAAAGDASCLLHIGGGLARLSTGIGTRHLAEILATTRRAP